ncbi:hypothetical protein R1flu_027635 [Riccia fluitans]|uniref:Mitochondrial transcription termination factor n=1 Tax=Riccia fluitans TaxID=41844 RepID=A0ABD1XJE9_9MARC
MTIENLTHRFSSGSWSITSGPGVSLSRRRISPAPSRLVRPLVNIRSNTLDYSAGPLTLGQIVKGRIHVGRSIQKFRGVKNVPYRGDVKSRSVTAPGIGSGGNAGETGSCDCNLEEEARAAVHNVLLEGGLSEVEASTVVSKAHGFLAEVVRKYKESEEELKLLDQLQLKTRRKAENSSASKPINDDSRVLLRQLASKSNGLAPLLESLGVNLPSIARISHALSSQRSSDLLDKVICIKEMLTVCVYQGRPLENLMRHMMKTLSVSPDEELQRTLSFYEKLEARRGFGALKETPYAIAQLLDSFPQIFLRDMENEIRPVMELMQEYGVPREKLGFIILCFPPLLLKDASAELRPRMKELKKVGVAARDYGRMIVRYPWILSQCVADNVQETFNFLESIKVLKSKIDGVITRCPQLLGVSSRTALVPMIEHLKKYGVKSKRLGRVIALAPQILTVSPEEFEEVVAFLSSYGYDSEEIAKLLSRAPEIFAASIRGTLQRKIDFLLELGIKRTKLFRIIRFFPEVLSMSVDDALRPRVKYLRDKGFSNNEISHWNVSSLRHPENKSGDRDSITRGWKNANYSVSSLYALRRQSSPLQRCCLAGIEEIEKAQQEL